MEPKELLTLAHRFRTENDHDAFKKLFSSVGRNAWDAIVCEVPAEEAEDLLQHVARTVAQRLAHEVVTDIPGLVHTVTEGTLADGSHAKHCLTKPREAGTGNGFGRPHFQRAAFGQTRSGEEPFPAMPRVRLSPNFSVSDFQRDTSKEITPLLHDWYDGENKALGEVLDILYDELRKEAYRYFRGEGKAVTIQPTALVHEVYLRLVNSKKMRFENRDHFFRFAAQLMRRILVECARMRQAQKRGPGLKITLDEESDSSVFPDMDMDKLLAFNAALDRLEKMDPRACRIIELRHFAGLTAGETASAMKLGIATVKRETEFARAWLRSVLAGESTS